MATCISVRGDPMKLIFVQAKTPASDSFVRAIFRFSFRDWSVCSALITILSYVYLYLYFFPIHFPTFFYIFQSAAIGGDRCRSYEWWMDWRMTNKINNIRQYKTTTDSPWFFTIEWNHVKMRTLRFRERDRAPFEREIRNSRMDSSDLLFPRTTLNANFSTVLVPSVCIWISCPRSKYPGNRVHGPGRARRRLISPPVRAKTDESRLSRLPERDGPMKR